MIKRQLDVLPFDQQNRIEVRDAIFEDVIGPDEHGRALCMGVCIKPTSSRSTTSSNYYHSEIARLEKEANERDTRYREEVEARENRHQEEIDMVRADLENEIQERVARAKRETLAEARLEIARIIREAGIPLPPAAAAAFDTIDNHA